MSAVFTSHDALLEHLSTRLGELQAVYQPLHDDLLNEILTLDRGINPRTLDRA